MTCASNTTGACPAHATTCTCYTQQPTHCAPLDIKRPVMIRAQPLKPLLLINLLLASLSSNADSTILWQNASATVTQGQHFKVDPAEQNALTLEHVSALSTGDSFAFIEVSSYPHADRSAGLYGEVAIRWSHNKLAADPITLGPITDILLTTNVEFGNETAEMLLFGPSIDLSLPGFDFFQLSLTRRESLNRVGDSSSEGWQMTPSFSVTWPIGRSEVVLDGFIDWVFATDEAAYGKNLQINPQLKYNLGKLLHRPDTRFYIGLEYYFWSDKFGIASTTDINTDQHALSVLIKYHF
jgi:nucleoside-specific outer membrane channel protein Tsx